MGEKRQSTTHKIAAAARRERAIGALLTSPTIAAAATACGLGESTLRKWLRQPKFQRAYADARRAALTQAIGGWVSATTEALATLRRNLNCGQPSAEVRAAIALYEGALKGEETLRVLGDLAEMREQIAALLEINRQAEEQG